MRKITELIEATSKLPPHVTDMLAQTVPWIAATIMLAAVLYFNKR